MCAMSIIKHQGLNHLSYTLGRKSQLEKELTLLKAQINSGTYTLQITNTGPLTGI